MAGPLGVSHLLVFSRTDAGANLRMARLPRGPTLSFRINSYSLMRDIRALQKNPKSAASDFKTAPLVVLNNFGGDDRHIKLMTIMFQNMFPSINVHKIKLADARRVIIFNLNTATGEIEFRHYSITIKATGISKSVKNILYADIPDMHKLEDVGDYILRGAGASESDVEDGPDSTVSIPRKPSGKQQGQHSEQRAIRLVELGPRLQLQLIKIQSGVCEGEVIHHAFVKKTAAEVKEIRKKKHQEAELKARRRKEQEANVEKKKQDAEARKQAGKAQGGDEDASDDEEDYDDEFDGDNDLDDVDMDGSEDEGMDEEDDE
ncbi:hypothetical protein HK102_010169 [Quaeritorhiza haematococci]|nr:hypothetical protein HK102_010169 [Quaeritorhiza haematococci]